ncbi:MAG: SUMF1/EgtB/PvdO family nonheme iron enzyme [Planctomycetota bacterium]|nr:SUMF1/EgtB/PvdO family nonheme iron enzyme [Planctomycetota bacterium]
MVRCSSQRRVGEKSLPTAAEWEYAARGDLAGKRFTWGDTPPQGGQAGEYLAGLAFHEKISAPMASPGSAFPPNGYGLSDMVDNTRDWCADWCRADAYAASPNG